MNRGMTRKFILSAAALLLATALVAAMPRQNNLGLGVAAQTKGAPTTMKAAGSKSGADANVKSDADKNSVGAAPGKMQARGAGPGACRLKVINHTDWYVKFYVDDNYAGTVPRLGILEVDTGNGATKIYGRADFDDQTYRPFGPATPNCQTEHTVNLWPPEEAKK